MKKLMILTIFIMVASNSSAEDFMYEEGVQLEGLDVRSTGIEFKVKKIVKKKKINITPNSSCQNSFIISPATDQFDALGAYLLAAKMKKKKINIEFDLDSTECWVPVKGVGLP